MSAMRNWSRPLGFVALIVVIAAAYYIGRIGRGFRRLRDPLRKSP